MVARPLIPKCYIWLKVSWLSTLWVTNPSAEKVITTSHRQVGGSPLRARARPVGAFQSDSWRTAGALKCLFFPSERRDPSRVGPLSSLSAHSYILPKPPSCCHGALTLGRTNKVLDFVSSETQIWGTLYKRRLKPKLLCKHRRADVLKEERGETTRTALLVKSLDLFLCCHGDVLGGPHCFGVDSGNEAILKSQIGVLSYLFFFYPPH